MLSCNWWVEKFGIIFVSKSGGTIAKNGPKKDTFLTFLSHSQVQLPVKLV